MGSRNATRKMATDSFDEINRLMEQAAEYKQQGRINDWLEATTAATDLRARQHWLSGDYQSALTLLEEMLILNRQVLAEDDSGIASILNAKGLMLRSLWDYRKAESCYREALALQQHALGERDPATLLTMHNLGKLLHGMGRYKDAERLFEKVLAGRISALGQSDPAIIGSWDALGQLSQVRGDYDRAEKQYRRALKIAESAPPNNPGLVLNVKSNLAALHLAMARYAEAEELFRELLESNRKLFGEQHDSYAMALSDLGRFHLETGDYPVAERLFRETLEIERRVFGNDHPKIAASLNALAEVHRRAGQYSKAEPLHQDALKRRRSTLGEQHPDYAQSLHNLALLYGDIGDFGKIIELEPVAIAVIRQNFGDNHPDLILSLTNLASAYEANEQYEAAEQNLFEALAICRDTLGESHPQAVITLNNLAALYRRTSHWAKAEAIYGHALCVFEKRPRADRLLFSYLANNLGEIYIAMARHEEAERLLCQALDIRRQALGEYHPNLANTQHHLAFVYAATGRLGACLDCMEQSLGGDLHRIGEVFAMASERQRMTYLEQVRSGLYLYLSVLLEDSELQRRLANRAWEFVLRRKGLSAEVLALQRETILGGRYPQLQPRLEKLLKLRQRIGQKAFAGPGLEGTVEHRLLLSKWQSEREALEIELSRQIPEMDMQTRLDDVSAAAIAKALPKGTLLIDFIAFTPFDLKAATALGDSRWKPSRYLAFVLAADKPDEIFLIDLGAADPIDDSIGTYRQAVIREGKRRAVRFGLAPLRAASTRDSGDEVRRAVFDPIMAALPKDVVMQSDQLYIATDGELARIPFETLPAADGGHLIDCFRIHYLTVARDLLRKAPRSSSEQSLVIADPDFDLAGSDPVGRPGKALAASPGEGATLGHGRRSRDLERMGFFGPLIGSRREGEQICNLLNAVALIGDAAVEQKVKACRSPSILHIASHGFFLPDEAHEPGRRNSPQFVFNSMSETASRDFGNLENPLLRSGIALAGANSWLRRKPLPPEAEDGFLTAEDVTGLDLTGTQLVVLSACETGLGNVRIGEGVFGLQRAFALAGARRLIMSLWTVPDEETQQLMALVYRHVLNEVPVPEALRQAQLEIKRSHPDCYTWGGFICQGDPGPIRFNSAIRKT